jgi:hypothetical protein
MANYPKAGQAAAKCAGEWPRTSDPYTPGRSGPYRTVEGGVRVDEPPNSAAVGDRQGGQQRRGPRPGARVGGDAGRQVSGHDRLVSAARSAGDGSARSSTLATVWINRARRVRVSGLARPAAGRSNGLRWTPGARRGGCTRRLSPRRVARTRSRGRLPCTRVPWCSERGISSFARYDFPAPDAARVTELWLSAAHRSQATGPARRC